MVTTACVPRRWRTSDLDRSASDRGGRRWINGTLHPMLSNRRRQRGRVKIKLIASMDLGRRTPDASPPAASPPGGHQPPVCHRILDKTVGRAPSRMRPRDGAETADCRANCRAVAVGRGALGIGSANETSPARQAPQSRWCTIALACGRCRRGRAIWKGAGRRLTLARENFSKASRRFKKHTVANDIELREPH
jgi:hypothetical protein